ncbi:MAG: 30S ribosomal protein S21 [Deltaproteobacteria bacterium]|nr:30S ribosomal protein S21 [Deltaproteobacteria bacterium]
MFRQAEIENQLRPVRGHPRRCKTTERKMIEVKVSNDMVDRAMRELKRKLIKEGLFKELSRRKFNIKPSMAKRLKRAQAEKMRKKEARRERERMERQY